MTRPLALAVALISAGAALGACTSPEPDAGAATVGEADVERLRARVFVATRDIDAEIARLEGEAAADSTRRAGYAPVLERLLQERSRLGARVDSLRPLPRSAFDTTAAAVGRQVARLRAAVGRARFDAAQDAPALQAAVAARLARFDDRVAAAGTRATADTTGRLRADLDSLAADRARLDARLTAFADTTAPAFVRLRRTVVRDAFALERRLDRLAPPVRPDSAAARPGRSE